MTSVCQGYRQSPISRTGTKALLSYATIREDRMHCDVWTRRDQMVCETSPLGPVFCRSGYASKFLGRQIVGSLLTAGSRLKLHNQGAWKAPVHLRGNVSSLGLATLSVPRIFKLVLGRSGGMKSITFVFPSYVNAISPLHPEAHLVEFFFRPNTGE